MKERSDTYSAEETKQRLQKVLRSAFNMKPTPLKAIPKKHGKAQPKRAARKVKQSA